MNKKKFFFICQLKNNLSLDELRNYINFKCNRLHFECWF